MERVGRPVPIGIFRSWAAKEESDVFVYDGTMVVFLLFLLFFRMVF